MPNFAERIENQADTHKATQLIAEVWANQNANGIVGDDTTDAPNVNYLNLVSAPPANIWVRPDLSEYEGVVVSYIGSRPNDR